MIIDLNALYHLFNNTIEIELCGGDFAAVEEKADRFFSALISFGAKLVFFLDGPLQEVKHETWIERQNDKYDKTIDILRDIERGVQINYIASEYSRSFPRASKSHQIATSAKKFGEFRSSSAGEDVDLVMARYAIENNGLAILTNDTDFLIFDGDWHYWSIKWLNIDKMTTREFIREVFKRHVSLSYEQLKLFATIGGNDIL